MANKTLSHDSIADKLMTKASRIRAKKRADAFLKRMTLDQLRKDRKMTQGKLALAMNTQQAKFPVSKNAPKSNSEHYAVPLADTSRFAPSSQTRTLNSRSPNSVAPNTDAKHVHPSMAGHRSRLAGQRERCFTRLGPRKPALRNANGARHHRSQDRRRGALTLAVSNRVLNASRESSPRSVSNCTSSCLRNRFPLQPPDGRSRFKTKRSYRQARTHRRGYSWLKPGLELSGLPLTQAARVFFPADFFAERGASINRMRGGSPILIRSASRWPTVI